MKDNIEAGSDIHAGDGGYSEGTQEAYEEFAKARNQSLAKSKIDRLAEQAMISVNNPTVNTDGKVVCDNWERGISISLFAELIVRECALIAGLMEHEGRKGIGANLLDAFGIQK
jgi:hypothetical protein